LSWLCSKCGRELCQDCVADMTVASNPATRVCSTASGIPHFQSDLRPVSRFQKDELSAAIDEMQLLVDQDPQSQIHSRNSEPHTAVEDMERMELGLQSRSSDEYRDLDAPRFYTDTFNDLEFLRHWSQGLPAVVGPIQYQGHWGPEYFIERYGTESVTLEDCETGETKPTTVADFFQSLLITDRRTHIWKLKVS
jgi:hypothetical protein